MTPQALERKVDKYKVFVVQSRVLDPTCHFGITSSPLLLHAAYYVVPAAGPGFSLQCRCRPCRDQIDVDCAISICSFTRHEAVQVMTTHGFSQLGLAVVMVPQELASQKKPQSRCYSAAAAAAAAAVRAAAARRQQNFLSHQNM